MTRHFVPCILCFVLPAVVQSELLFNNALRAGLAEEGLKTGIRPAGGWYSDVQEGNVVFGWSFRQFSIWLADDFTVPSGGWLIREFATFGEQAGVSGLTIDSGSIEICRDTWDGKIVSTGTFHRAELTDIYRSIWYDHSREYQIQKVTYRLNAVLPPGNYWARWTAKGNVSVGGPFAPALTKAGSLGVPGANAMQRQVTTWIHWEPVYDGGSLTPQDLPFMITGKRLSESGGGVEAPVPIPPDPLESLLAAGGQR